MDASFNSSTDSDRSPQHYTCKTKPDDVYFEQTDGYFLWIDNWQLNMERWAPYEPKKDRPCVYVDVDGTWKTAHCNQTYYSLCKKSTGEPYSATEHLMQQNNTFTAFS